MTRYTARDLHLPDGSHRSIAPTTNGHDLEVFERAMRRHLEDGHDHETYYDQLAEAAGHLGAYSWVLMDTWDGGDPWGSVMGSAFTLNDVLHLAGGETNETYRPGLAGPSIEDDHGGEDLLNAIKGGVVMVEAVETAEQKLNALLDELKVAGLDY